VNSVTAARSSPTVLALVRAVPVWAWLVGLVALSVVLRYGIGRRTVAPWIMVDELIYSELAKSFADSGSFDIRGEEVGAAYGVVYPALISPAFGLFESIPDAYAAAKAINALVISLAAVPAYFLARRVVSPGLSLLAAVLSVALPSLLYAGTLMTENAFYPLFLCAALAMVLTLEQPTRRRVAILFVVSGVAFATRVQALVLAPALLTAPVVLVALQRRGLRSLAAYRWLYGAVAAALVAFLAIQAVRGQSLLDPLGAYRVAGDESYDASEVARWLLYHVAELDLSLGIAPLFALLLLIACARRLEGRDRVFLAATASLSAWLVFFVAVFASRHAVRVEERNMFYVAPLLLIALLLWIERGLPRPRLPAAVAAVAVAGLPALLPFSSLIGVSAVSDTFGLLPWWTVHEWGVPLDRLWLVVLLAGSVVAALMIFLPRRLALVIPALLLVFFAVTTQPVEERIRGASIGALFQGITRPQRDWIDRTVRSEEAVAAIHSGELDQLAVLENEFFSRAVGPVYTLAEPLPGGLEQTPLTAERRSGLLLDPGGSPVTAPYALVDGSVPLAGRRVARDERKGLAVLRVGGPLRVTHSLGGVYDDGWSGPVATYTRYRCAGGAVAVVVESDPNLFRRSQVVIARVRGKVLAVGRIPRVGRGRLTVPLRPEAGDRCRVRFAITPTAVPGAGDRRRLGTHFRGFTYRP
jgi:dolichyl-phosphate-mannose-protein mannosyltransferase